MTSAPAYRTFSAYLKETFGQRVQKISLDAGLGCPHRDALGQGGCIYCNDLGSGTGLSRKGVPLERQIIDQIRGYDYSITPRAVDVQIVSLRKKLDKCAKYIETVRGVGYRFRE